MSYLRRNTQVIALVLLTSSLGSTIAFGGSAGTATTFGATTAAAAASSSQKRSRNDAFRPRALRRMSKEVPLLPAGLQMMKAMSNILPIAHMHMTSMPVAEASMLSPPEQFFGNIHPANDLASEMIQLLPRIIDIVTAFTPDTFLLRMINVLGKTVDIASWGGGSSNPITVDYGHHMDVSCILDSTGVAASIAVVLLSVFPLILDTLRPAIKSRDMISYDRVFRPAGMSWLEYRTVAPTTAIDWVNMPANTSLFQGDEKENEQEECVYWLFDGEVEFITDDGEEENVTRKISATKGTTGEEGRSGTILSKEQHIGETIRVGESGATLLQINPDKLAMMRIAMELSDGLF